LRRLARPLRAADVGQVRRRDRDAVGDPADDAARLAMTRLRVAVANADQRVRLARVRLDRTGDLDRVVVRGSWQADGEPVGERLAAEDGVAPARHPDRSTSLRLDERERVDGGIADMAPGQAGELRGLVVEAAVGRHHRYLLERGDVRVEVAQDGRDPLEPVVADVPPPGRREGLSGPDRGPDVPG